MSKVNYNNKYLSTDKILNGVLKIFKDNFDSTSHGSHLDIGSGSGALVKLIKQVAPNFSSNCVDYTDKLIDDKSIPLAVVDLNFENLPHSDNSFDFVTCTEVIEHLENYRLIVRETFRVTKPGGLAIFTTPNVLNLNSRLRYLSFGFHNLFGPLPINRDEAFSTGGHITPVQYFYLAHSLAEAGFTNIKLQFDKKQTSAIPWLIFLYPLINIFSMLASRKELKKGFINEKNKNFIKSTQSMDMLLGRTIIVSAKKSANF